MQIEFTKQGKKITHPSGFVVLETLSIITKKIEWQQRILGRETKKLTTLKTELVKITQAEK